MIPGTYQSGDAARRVHVSPMGTQIIEMDTVSIEVAAAASLLDGSAAWFEPMNSVQWYIVIYTRDPETRYIVYPGHFDEYRSAGGREPRS